MKTTAHSPNKEQIAIIAIDVSITSQKLTIKFTRFLFIFIS
jgi:hypothetical protein